jgi:hypothetical protein
MKPTMGRLSINDETVMLSRVSGSMETLWEKPPAALRLDETRRKVKVRRSRMWGREMEIGERSKLGCFEGGWEGGVLGGRVFEKASDQKVGGEAFEFGAVVEEEAMAEDVGGGVADVFVGCVKATFDESARFGGSGEGEGSARASAIVNTACVGLAGLSGVNEAGDEVGDGDRHENAADEFEQTGEVFPGEDLGDLGFDADFTVEDDLFQGGCIVGADFEFEEETVELGLG